MVIEQGLTTQGAAGIASVYALAGNSVTAGSYPYSHQSSLFDVTSGSNGSCGGSYLCTGQPGYDGPTGLGTPNGVAAFGPGAPVTPVADFTVAASPSATCATWTSFP